MAEKYAITADATGPGSKNKRLRVSMSEDVVLIAEQFWNQNYCDSQKDWCVQIQTQKSHNGGGQGNQEPGRNSRRILQHPASPANSEQRQKRSSHPRCGQAQQNRPRRERSALFQESSNGPLEES